jgi:hypothetical protein
MSDALDLAELAKYDLLRTAQSEPEYRKVLSRLDAKQLKAVQKHYWDFLIEESQQAKTRISRADILSKLEATAKYQQRARCKEPEGYCTISMCVRINPSCAVTRISEIMLSVRPMVARLVMERPELLQLKTVPREEPAPEPMPEPEPVHEEGIKPRRERSSQVVSEAQREPFARYKNALGKMVEVDGLEHVALMTDGGGILQSVSNQPMELAKLVRLFVEEISAVEEQGEVIGLKPLLTVTKEYTHGVAAIRALGKQIYLVAFSTIVLPAKIHSLITKLGTTLTNDIERQGI